jgi:hypothetical protein
MLRTHDQSQFKEMPWLPRQDKRQKTQTGPLQIWTMRVCCQKEKLPLRRTLHLLPHKGWRILSSRQIQSQVLLLFYKAKQYLRIRGVLLIRALRGRDLDWSDWEIWERRWFLYVSLQDHLVSLFWGRWNPRTNLLCLRSQLARLQTEAPVDRLFLYSLLTVEHTTIYHWLRGWLQGWTAL